MSLPRFGVTKPVPVNLLMMATIIAGIVSALTLRREFFPETTPEQASVSLPYPGATPEQIEESMGRKVEDALADLKEVDRITTTISENAGTILVEFQENVNIDKAVREVEKAMDALMDLPDDAEEIVVTEFEPNLPAIMLTLFGDADEEVMKRAIRRIRDDLKSLPGMGEILISGTRRYEVRVDVAEHALLQHGISLPQISDSIRSWTGDAPGGTVRTDVGNINVRTMGVPERAEEIRNIVIRANSQGQVLRVGDIASVSENFVDDQIIRRFNGRSSVSLTVFKTGDQDAVQIAKMARAYAAGQADAPFQPSIADRLYFAVNAIKAARNPNAPPARTLRKVAYDLGVSSSRTDPLPGQIVTHSDLARFIEGRLELLSRNAAQGAVLVFLVLLFVLNWRAAFWVMVGLVTALCGTIVVMGSLGITLNLLTMFGLIIVVGMLVDDAIVVAENIQARHDRGETSLDAAIKGAEEVQWPVVATVSTTIVAFLPLTFVKGNIGDLLGALPMVVACALAASLVESILILPSHIGHSLVKRDRRRTETASRLQRFEKWRDLILNDRILPAYERMMRVLLEYRYITTAGAAAVFIISFGMVAGGRLEFVFLDDSDSETIMVSVRTPIGTALAETERIARAIEEAAEAQPESQSVSVVVGQIANLDTGQTDANATHVAQLFIELVPVEQRDRESSRIIAAMREHHGILHGAEQIRYTEIGAGGSGPDITIQVQGENNESMMAVVANVRNLLAERQGVYDIADDNFNSQRELQITPTAAAQAAGFSKRDIDQQVRGALYGLEAHTFSADREDIDVRVRLDEQSRRTLSTIDNMWVIGQWNDRGDQGPANVAAANLWRIVPLREIADVREGVGFSTIRRIDRKRTVTVTADTAPDVSPETIMTSLQPELDKLAEQYHDVTIDVGGRQRDFGKAFSSLPMGMAAALLMIYVILAWLFSSYVQPLVVMLAIPFGIIGVVWGHMIFGYRATFLSMIGFIALCGIVVNNSLILVQFYNAAYRSGLSVRDALLQAGKQRLRPILLTSVTTFLGLTPLMLEQSFQAKFLIPMAISISFGLMSSTVLVLTALPCFMVIVDDVKAAAHYLWFGLPRPSRTPSVEATAVESD